MNTFMRFKIFCCFSVFFLFMASFFLWSLSNVFWTKKISNLFRNLLKRFKFKLHRITLFNSALIFISVSLVSLGFIYEQKLRKTKFFQNILIFFWEKKDILSPTSHHLMQSLYCFKWKQHSAPLYTAFIFAGLNLRAKTQSFSADL